jgi:phosphotransferase system HPr (HPr) family protein
MASKTAHCTVTVLMPQGLHLRPADMLVKTVSRFSSQVVLRRPNDHENFDCRSILSLMTVAAVQGTELILQADGDDCEEALAEVVKLFENGFGELENGVSS